MVLRADQTRFDGKDLKLTMQAQTQLRKRPKSLEVNQKTPEASRGKGESNAQACGKTVVVSVPSAIKEIADVEILDRTVR